MELNIYGLKCDNQLCNYNDESIKLEDYPMYIDCPCPKCGESLLTQADFDTTMKIVKLTEWASSMSFDTPPVESDMIYKMNVKLNGSGVPDIVVSEVKK